MVLIYLKKSTLNSAATYEFPKINQNDRTVAKVLFF